MGRMRPLQRHIMNFTQLKAFYYVAKHGSFTLKAIRGRDMMMTIENSGRPETMQSRMFIEQAFRGAALNRRAI